MYVEAPVKFMATKLVTVGISRTHAIVLAQSSTVSPRAQPSPPRINTRASPSQAPFTAKARPGSQGSNVGVRAAPAANTTSSKAALYRPADRTRSSE